MNSHNSSRIQDKNQNIRQQQQQQQQVQRQLQGETQYTVYKDLENFLGILVESNTVCQTLEKDDPLINIHINRLIAQLNLSKSIHYDTQSTADDKGNSDQLSDLKKNAQNIIQQYLQEQQIEIDGLIEQYLKEYMEILQKRQHTLQITKLIPTNRVNNLQEQQINNLLTSMNAVDQDYQRLRKGEQFQLDKSKLFQRIKDRIKVAEQKIKSYKQSSSQNHKQKNSKQQQEKQEDNEEYQLSKESIEFIEILIKISSGIKSEDHIYQLRLLIQNITSSKSSQINAKQQFDKQNDKKLDNPFVNKIIQEIEIILSKLADQNKAKQMVINIKKYLLQQCAIPLYSDWKNKFDKQDIKIVKEFMDNSMK